MDDEEISLGRLFAQSRTKQHQLETLDPRSNEFKTTLQSIVQSLERCRKLIDGNSVFSPNEELEDISTQDIQFLSVDYLLAEHLMKSYGNNRLEVLQKSSELLENFLSRLDLYGVLSSSDRKLYETFLENRKSFSIVSSNNAEERRKVKVSRFQEEKTLKQRLEHLRNQSQSINVDDETIRSLYLAEIALFANQTFQSLDMITQESEILSKMQQLDMSRTATASQPDGRAPQRSGGYSERLDGPVSAPGLGQKGGPLLSSTGKPLQPFTLLDKRSQLRDGVFRPSHNLPTMSIDEYLEEERRRGGIIEGGGNANANQPEPDEDNLEQVDAATMKAREWDEFVEANPKGAGNTLNRG